jgi:uncharacterized damage-inducible protein DinB
MNVPVIPLKEFDQEMAATRRLLERVPAEHGRWKPHEKSFALGNLAQLVSWIPDWIARTLRDPHIDLARSPRYSFESTETILRELDANAAAARAALEAVTGAALDEEWSLRMGYEVLTAMPRGEAVRGHLNHLIHHRGQLTVYLRLLEVPLPPIYGPTADEH